MALQDIITRMNTDIINEFDGVDPTLPNSFFKSIVYACAGRFNEQYGALDLLKSRILLLTTQDDFTAQWATTKALQPLPASPSIGSFNVTGSAGVSVAVGDAFQASNGGQYLATTTATLTLQTVVGSTNVTGVVVTVTTGAPHGLATGMTVGIASAGAPSALVGAAFVIDVTGTTTFTYTITAIVGDGPQGNISVSATYATVSAQSVDLGADTNLAQGTQLTPVTVIAGINTAYVTFGGFTGGTDVESYEALRARTLYAMQHPIGYGSVSYYENLLLSFSGITRVWVLPRTPAIGQITIYYVRDNQAGSILPSPSDLIAVRDLIPTPAELNDVDIHVLAPTLLPVTFTFTALAPNTASIQNAINAALRQYFAENVNVQGTSWSIPANDYIRAILSAVDVNTGEVVQTYTLSTPSGAISVGAGELPVYVTPTYP